MRSEKGNKYKMIRIFLFWGVIIFNLKEKLPFIYHPISPLSLLCLYLNPLILSMTPDFVFMLYMVLFWGGLTLFLSLSLFSLV